MDTGSQLQVAKLAQMCQAVPSGARCPAPCSTKISLELIIRCFHLFYVLLKKEGYDSSSASDHRHEGPKRAWGPKIESKGSVHIHIRRLPWSPQKALGPNIVSILT